MQLDNTRRTARSRRQWIPMVLAALAFTPTASNALAGDAPHALSRANRPQQVKKGEVTREDAEAAVRVMQDVIASIGRKVDEARKQRDILRLNCIDEKRNLMAGLLQVAQDALEELRSMQDGPPEAVEHELGRIVIAAEKVEGYATDAELCVGSVAFREGDAVERSFHNHDDGVDQSDPTRPEPVETPGFRPPPASPMN